MENYLLLYQFKICNNLFNFFNWYFNMGIVCSRLSVNLMWVVAIFSYWFQKFWIFLNQLNLPLKPLLAYFLSYFWIEPNKLLLIFILIWGRNWMFESWIRPLTKYSAWILGVSFESSFFTSHRNSVCTLSSETVPNWNISEWMGAYMIMNIFLAYIYLSRHGVQWSSC